MCKDKQNLNEENKMATSYAEAGRDGNKYKNKNKSDECKIGNVKPIFLDETDVFGENDMNHLGQRPFLINIEVYRAIEKQVPVRAFIWVTESSRHLANIFRQ